MAVEKRLDEIFGEDMKRTETKEAKLKLVKPPSFASLRIIIMSLEWEVTDDNLKDLMRELSRLQRVYIKDPALQKLLGLLFHLGRYIKIYQSDTNPHIFKMLFQAYNGLTKISSGKYSSHQKAKIVNDEIKRYLSLQSYLKRKNKNIYRRAVNKLNTLEKSRLSSIDSLGKQKPYQYKGAKKIHHSTLNNNFMELKKFIYLEIQKLRKDLQRITALIDAKA